MSSNAKELESQENGVTLNYPETRRDETVFDIYAETEKVFDPYRHLENPDSEETKTWVAQQNVLVEQFLKQNKEQHESIKNRLKDLINYEKVDCPFKGGENFYFFKNDGLQNQSVLYQVKGDKFDYKKAQVFLDPNTLSKDGTTSLGSIYFSEKGEYMAYTLSRSGSDWRTIYVKDVNTGKDLEKDKLYWCKFTSIAWLHDGSGFFYTRYPKLESMEKEVENENSKLGSEVQKNENQSVYFHKIGQDQSQDILIYKDSANPEHMFGVLISDDGKYLLIKTFYSTANKEKLYYAKISDGFDGTQKINIVRLIDEFKAEYNYICNDENIFYFKTNLDASNSRVITVDFDQDSSKDLKIQEIIKENEYDVLCDATCVNQKDLVLCYVHNVQDVLKLYNLKGEYIKDLNIPANGQVSSLYARRKDETLYFKYTSFTSAGSIYQYNLKAEEISCLHETEFKGMDTSEFETQQVWYESKDGTKIPMFLVYKKGRLERVKKDGTSDIPTLLYGYGGFNIALKPYFSSVRLCFLHHFDGLFALANIRGGDEFGEKWHQQGILENKQNVFDDFQYAAKYLIDQKYTNPSKLVIQGGSNGGLLVAACMTQRPDLFGCVLAQVPVIDMLRFHKFTIGYAWTSDYGCADKPDEFKYLYKYSPLHNIQSDKPHPALMVLTSDHDDRVVPLHSFKFVATLQHKLTKENGGKTQQQPLLIRVETKAGHGAGLPVYKIIEEYADMFHFVSLTCNVKWIP